jgi:hypothetical protein
MRALASIFIGKILREIKDTFYASDVFFPPLSLYLFPLSVKHTGANVPELLLYTYIS